MQFYRMQFAAPLNTRARVLRMAAGLAAAVVLLTTAGALAQAGLRLIIGGKTVSTDVRIIGGRPYISLADMARAMNGVAVKHNGGYEINMGRDTTTPQSGSGARAESGGSTASGGGTAGGANEVHGTRGNIGQVLFNGKWRFSVVGVDHAASYDSQFLPEKRAFAPNGETEELVIVRCRMKNGQQESKMPMLSPIHPVHTALADSQGQSYPPMDYDKRGGHTDEGPNMLPGAQTEFAILFSVPKGTTVKDLVFSVQNTDQDAEAATDVRIALAQ